MSDPTGPSQGLEVDDRPVGRDEVIEATLRAAAVLFSERNPSQVSVREIAARAGVSHALVHRYLGSKEDIFRATLLMERKEAADYWQEHHGAEETPGTMRADLPPGRFIRTVMRAELDGLQIADEDLKMPHADKMLELLTTQDLSKAVGDKPFDPRLLFAAATAMMAGMAVCEEFFLVQSGLENEDREELQREFSRLLLRIVSLAHKP